LVRSITSVWGVPETLLIAKSENDLQVCEQFFFYPSHEITSITAIRENLFQRSINQVLLSMQQEFFPA